MARSSSTRSKTRAEAPNIKQLYWILGGLSLITVFLIFFVIGDYGLYQIYQVNRQKQHIQAHLKQLMAEQDSLLAERQRLEGDLNYIEKLAREKYRMAKKGEKVFRVIEHSSKK
jgi:cell division protein FtsB